MERNKKIFMYTRKTCVPLSDRVQSDREQQEKLHRHGRQDAALTGFQGYTTSRLFFLIVFHFAARARTRLSCWRANTLRKRRTSLSSWREEATSSPHSCRYYSSSSSSSGGDGIQRKGSPTRRGIVSFVCVFIYFARKDTKKTRQEGNRIRREEMKAGSAEGF